MIIISQILIIAFIKDAYILFLISQRLLVTSFEEAAKVKDACHNLEWISHCMS